MTTPTTPAHDDHLDTGEPHHEYAVRTYVRVYIALLVLLVVTVAAAFMHLGHVSIIVAMAIAVTKAALVVIYFMHVRMSSPIIKVYAVAGLLWLGILATLTFSDYLTRTWLPNSEGWAPPVQIRRPG
jgi:cytochrome c oxidase subunit 4